MPLSRSLLRFIGIFLLTATSLTNAAAYCWRILSYSDSGSYELWLDTP